MRFRFMLLSIIIATATYKQRAGLCSSEPNMRFRFMHAAVDHDYNCRLQAKTNKMKSLTRLKKMTFELFKSNSDVSWSIYSIIHGIGKRIVSDI